MLRSYLGDIGHFLVILSFVSALAATWFYSRASQETTEHAPWSKWARGAFFVHTIGVIGVTATLFTIIFNHYFEYHYAWDNTSLSLPLGYAISCFWQDQEGSFLLWMFWNALLGLVLISSLRKKKQQGFEGPVMAIFSGVQAFLTSMILGVVIWGEFKLGSSPFLLLRESMPDLPVWKSDPNFVPVDGNGLNPLLQNYWMVIHPPTLFLGFALTLVPFAFALAGLWQKKYTEWIKPALPWTLISGVVLGTGIMMGAIWAYETLNFGGYWNWDPVENAVYVPWLVLVASFHTMLLAPKNSSALKYSFILVVAQFILILYSTFLTRSGILGNASVHSFTDLGLSGQLLVYLLFFIGIAVALMFWRWKNLPADEQEVATYSKEFWIFLGVLTLCLTSFQVIVTTSIPVYNKIAQVFGFDLNMAMPTDQIMHYTKFQQWFFVVITILTGIAQYFWWKKIKKESLQKLTNPAIITLLVAASLITLTKVNNWQYILILTAGVFSVVANGSVLLDIIKGKWEVAGGAITHMGVALMLIGIMYSSGYNKIVTVNQSGSEIFSNNDEANKENVVLWLNRPLQVGPYKLTYRGQFVDVRDVPGFIEKRFIQPVPTSSFLGIAKADIMDGDKLFFKRGDTVAYEAENTYYQVQYATAEGDTFNLYPRFQINEKMGNVASPDIKKFANRDIYSHVTYVNVDEDREWSAPETFKVAVRDTFFLNDYVAILDEVVAINEVDGLPLSEGDAAARATLRILERDGEKRLYPTFVIKDREIWSKPEVSLELGLRAQLTEIDPVNGQFSFDISRTQRDFIVLKAEEKPQINLLWIGTAMLVVGMTLAAIRRYGIYLKTA
ncbi:MAG: cytochrome c biogenesis protein CcsA [Spirosomataceae bacterium]